MTWNNYYMKSWVHDLLSFTEGFFCFKPSGKERKHCSLAYYLTLIWHLYCQVLFNYFGLIMWFLWVCACIAHALVSTDLHFTSKFLALWIRDTEGLKTTNPSAQTMPSAATFLHCYIQCSVFGMSTYWRIGLGIFHFSNNLSLGEWGKDYIIIK